MNGGAGVEITTQCITSGFVQDVFLGTFYCGTNIRIVYLLAYAFGFNVSALHMVAENPFQFVLRIWFCEISEMKYEPAFEGTIG